MNTYISLLRGINVSGHKKVKMTELKKVYESLGFKHVTTYIQSGNVVFQSSKNIKTIKTSIETGINDHFNFDVPVLVLNHSQLENTAKDLPFPTIDIEQEGSKIIIFFLSETISNSQEEIFSAYLSNSEQLVMSQDVIYLYCPEGLGKSKLTNKLIETKLKLISTARNIKTVNKLLSLANS
ncbi:MAG: DUF1697 domain-containing protein [Colwellia sp.]|nr:DUF1697 domain-containing protein [Colwellia sp.]